MKLLFSKVKDRLQFLRSLKVRIFIIILAVGIIPTMVLRNAILQNYESGQSVSGLQMSRISLRSWQIT